MKALKTRRFDDLYQAIGIRSLSDPGEFVCFCATATNTRSERVAAGDACMAQSEHSIQPHETSQPRAPGAYSGSDQSCADQSLDHELREIHPVRAQFVGWGAMPVKNETIGPQIVNALSHAVELCRQIAPA